MVNGKPVVSEVEPWKIEASGWSFFEFFLVCAKWDFYFWRVRTGIGENARDAND